MRAFVAKWVAAGLGRPGPIFPVSRAQPGGPDLRVSRTRVTAAETRVEARPPSNFCDLLPIREHVRYLPQFVISNGKRDDDG